MEINVSQPEKLPVVVIACLVLQNLPEGHLKPTNLYDDIVISVVGVRNLAVVHRWPLGGVYDPLDPENSGDRNADEYEYHFVDQWSWSFYGNQQSLIDNATIENRLQAGPGAPATGFVIVEVFYAHPQFTGFFILGNMIPNPIQARAYTIFPVVAAEPPPP